MRLEEIDYDLPAEAIAQSAIEPRDAARMLVCSPDGTLTDARVSELPAHLEPGDLLVVNETRVRKARVLGRRRSGGAVEILFLGPSRSSERGQVSVAGAPHPANSELASGSWWEALVRPSRRIGVGEIIVSELGLEFEVGEKLAGGRRLARSLGIETADALERVGEIPLPPYFTGNLPDPERYQTRFASRDGSAAAPTAGLHFTDRLIASLLDAGVGIATIDLEVGVDTFRPVTEADPLNHEMHSEKFFVSDQTVAAIEETRARGGAVIAVGTTSLRAIEAATGSDGVVAAGGGEARLLLGPGSHFHVDGLLTNFHAPCTTLILLLAGLMPTWRDAYSHALSGGYRFLSFGDTMLVEPIRR